VRLLATHSPGFDPSLPWTELQSVPTAQSPLFRMLTVRRRSPHTGREATFTRLLCPDWINVIAVTEDGEFLLVEQYRHGTDAASLEVVGGVCDPGEEPPDTARRELREETGCEAAEWIPLGSSAPNPAIQDNHCHFFLALGCRQVAPLDLDPSEELRVWALSFEELDARIRSGEIRHSLVLNAFLRLTQWDGWEALRKSLLEVS
jgi:ADP-ribose pyrophosphatase